MKLRDLSNQQVRNQLHEAQIAQADAARKVKQCQAELRKRDQIRQIAADRATVMRQQGS